MAKAKKPESGPVEPIPAEPVAEHSTLDEPVRLESGGYHYRLDDGWHHPQRGTWQVSVAPDSLIQLPRHLKPEEVEDFIHAVRDAAKVGAEVKAALPELPTAPAAPQAPTFPPLPPA